jgi:3-hydroxybutyrate dehydrogenase
VNQIVPVQSPARAEASEAPFDGRQALVTDQTQLHGIEEADVIDDVLLERNAVRRLIEPAEVAVAFFCGVGAWSMTGSALSMDAGWLAH